ncbi:MAG: SMI1/KNR4 family protein, partial [Myxococcota bacterium]
MTEKEALSQALDDIKEWLFDHQAEEIVTNLRPPVDKKEIVRAEERLGYKLPEALRWLYTLHDGQRTFEENLFFPDGAFLPLFMALRETDEIV